MDFHHWSAAVLVGYLAGRSLAWFWALAATPLCSKCLGTVQLPIDSVYI